MTKVNNEQFLGAHKIARRGFLSLLGAGLGSAALSGCAEWFPTGQMTATAVAQQGAVPAKEAPKPAEVAKPAVSFDQQQVTNAVRDGVSQAFSAQATGVTQATAEARRQIAEASAREAQRRAGTPTANPTQVFERDIERYKQDLEGDAYLDKVRQEASRRLGTPVLTEAPKPTVTMSPSPQAASRGVDLASVQATGTKAPEVLKTPVPTSWLETSKEVVWGDEVKFTVTFGDLPDGDRTAYTIVQVWRQSNDRRGGDINTLTHILVQPGYIIRMVHEGLNLQGAQWHVWAPKGRQQELVFRMQGMAEEVRRRDRVEPYLLYVGEGDAPQGFSRNLPGWARNWVIQRFPDLSQDGMAPTVEAKAAGQRVDSNVPEGELKFDEKSQMVRGTDLSLKVERGKRLLFQGWDGENANTTIQVIVEEETEVLIPGKIEGTYWVQASGSLDRVVARADEMVRELKQDPKKRDLTIKTYYVGKKKTPEGSDFVPDGAEKAPTSWQIK